MRLADAALGGVADEVHQFLNNGDTGKLRRHTVKPLAHRVATGKDRVIGFTQLADILALDAYDAGKRANWWRLATHAPLRFLQLFLLRGGILDGRAGIVVCGLAAWYTFLKDIKLWAMRNCRVSAAESVTAARAAVERRAA